MNASRLGTLDVEEQAAYWLRVMESPSPQDRAMFWVWVQSSPAHVRELLLASKLDHELESIDRARRIDVEALICRAVAQEEIRRRASRMARARLRQAPHWFTGIAASIAFVGVAAFLIPTVNELRSGTAAAPAKVRGVPSTRIESGKPLERIAGEFDRYNDRPKLARDARMTFVREENDLAAHDRHSAMP